MGECHAGRACERARAWPIKTPPNCALAQSDGVDKRATVERTVLTLVPASFGAIAGETTMTPLERDECDVAHIGKNFVKKVDFLNYASFLACARLLLPHAWFLADCRDVQSGSIGFMARIGVC